GIRSIFPEAITRIIIVQLSKFAFLGRLRGFRGLLLDVKERKAFLQKMIGSADCLTAPSAFLANLIQSIATVARPIRVIHSGHDLSWLAAMPEKAPSELIRLGYMGQIVPVKGLDLLISAFISSGIESKAQLSICGDMTADPVYAASLKTAAAGNRSIRFMGAFPLDQLGQVLSQMDILVVPSQWHENNPRVIQEAFACKIPVIASDVGGISEFVQHERTGLLFRRDSVTELAQIFQRVVSYPSIIEALQANIRPPRTMREEVGDLAKIYQELLFH
ncbi:MAG: glycosyltransferase, partial [Acidobacteria bacterium]|nr:glycosyltransferase [Acidobacteriota bacterium]